MTGVAGITDTLANSVPEFGLSLHELARAGRWGEMNDLYQGAFEVLEIEQIYGRAGLKAIANLCGRNVGPTRHPMTDTLTLADREDIERRLWGWALSRDLLGKGPHVAAR
jgi:dihydrodipicolinate synthase/N-acetylneuraminate lyase